MFFFFFSSRRRHTRLQGDWSSDVCSSDLAEYLLRSIGRDPALPENAGLVHYVAAAAIAVTAALNYYGVRWSAFVLNLTTGAKYGALLLLVLLAFFVGHGDWTHFTTAAGPLTPGLFGLALVSVLWAYDGWGDLSFVGGEVRDPERNLPRALVMGTAAIIAIYLFVNAAYLYLLPLGQMDRKSTRLNSSHLVISYAVFCLKKKTAAACDD